MLSEQIKQFLKKVFQGFIPFFESPHLQNFFDSLATSAIIGSFMLAMQGLVGLQIDNPGLALAAITIGFVTLFAVETIRTHHIKKTQRILEFHKQVAKETEEIVNPKPGKRLKDTFDNIRHGEIFDATNKNWKAQLNKMEVMACLQQSLSDKPRRETALNMITSMYEGAFGGLRSAGFVFALYLLPKTLYDYPSNDDIERLIVFAGAIFGIVGFISKTINIEHEWNNLDVTRAEIELFTDAIFEKLSRKNSTQLTTHTMQLMKMWSTKKASLHARAYNGGSDVDGRFKKFLKIIQKFFLSAYPNAAYYSVTSASAIAKLLLALQFIMDVELKLPALAVASVPVGFALLFTSSVIRTHHSKKHHQLLDRHKQLVDETNAIVNPTRFQQAKIEVNNMYRVLTLNKPRKDWVVQLNDPEVLACLRHHLIISNRRDKFLNVVTDAFESTYASVGASSWFFMNAVIAKTLGLVPKEDYHDLANVTLFLASVFGLVGFIQSVFWLEKDWKSLRGKRNDVREVIEEVLETLSTKDVDKLSRDAFTLFSMWANDKDLERQQQSSERQAANDPSLTSPSSSCLTRCC